jgi:GT2 family glycosyltransferase
LARCLQSIDEQEYSPEEVIVIAQKIDYETINLAKTKKINLYLVSSPGVVFAIKCSLKLVSTQLVSFIDDDVTLPKDWVKKAVRAFDANSNLGALGGTDLQKGIVREDNIHVGLITFFGKLVGNHHLASGPKRNVDFLKGCNLVMRKTVAENFSPVFELLKGNGAQVGNDLVLSLNSRLLGMETLFDPDFYVFHHVEPRKDSSPRNNLSIQERKDLIFNIVLIKLTFARSGMRFLVLLYQVIVGDREVPGFVRSLTLNIVQIKHTIWNMNYLWRAIPMAWRLSSVHRNPLKKYARKFPNADN